MHAFVITACLHVLYPPPALLSTHFLLTTPRLYMPLGPYVPPCHGDDTWTVLRSRSVPREQKSIANAGALAFAAGCSVVASGVAEISPHVSGRYIMHV